MIESQDTESHGGSDPEDQTSGGTGGEQGRETSESQVGDQKLGSDIGEDDIGVDSEGEPTTKPGASEQTPGESQGS